LEVSRVLRVELNLSLDLSLEPGSIEGDQDSGPEAEDEDDHTQRPDARPHAAVDAGHLRALRLEGATMERLDLLEHVEDEVALGNHPSAKLHAGLHRRAGAARREDLADEAPEISDLPAQRPKDPLLLGRVEHRLVVLEGGVDLCTAEELLAVVVVGGRRVGNGVSQVERAQQELDLN